MFGFPVPCKVDWLNLAYIANTMPVQLLSDVLISDLENTFFEANRQPSESGYTGYAVRWPVGFYKGKNYQHLANVSYGGNTKTKHGDHVQLSITGANADTYFKSSQIRSEQRLAYIQRIDLAYDVSGDYNAIIDRVKTIKELSRLKWETITSTEHGQQCTTTYIGSRKSAFFVRIYEKGKQTGGDPLWVRIEFEVKPTKTSSDFAIWCYEQYQTNPENILTRCKFAHAILSALFDNGIAAYAPREEKPTPSTVRSFTHMIEQYASVIAGLSELYDVDDMVTLAKKIHRLKQSDDDATRGLVSDTIYDYLEKNQRPLPEKKSDTDPESNPLHIPYVREPKS